MTGVILAAGGGKRMGRPKLLLPLGGRPLLGWAVELVARLPLAERLIVLGFEAEALERAVPLEGWRILINPCWEQGLASSLRCAAQATTQGMLLFLGDMPWVPEEGARAVLARAGERPVALAYRGQRGFPVYLPPGLRPEILALSGDVGARSLLGECELIPWDDPGVIRDVDVPEDLCLERS